jgi:copper chaperone NosL
MCDSCQPSGLDLNRRHFLCLFVPTIIAASAFPMHFAQAGAKTLELPAPGSNDTCPVCGMFVAKYPYWIATVLYKDNHADHFDGAKDFFKYLLDMKKYARGRTRDQIAAMGVTGYYDPVRLDANEACYVVGSDVLGPMGHELVPLVDEAEAKEFMNDHKGKRILRFADMSVKMLNNLDQGKFE